MIGLRDTATLARTKLRSKRLMLIITIVVSGLLFGVLYLAVIILAGVTNSADRYTRAANDGKYLVQSSPVLPGKVYGVAGIDPPQELVKELKKMQKDYDVRQKALVEKYDLPYVETEDDDVIQVNPFFASLGEEHLMVNRLSPVYDEYMAKVQADYVKTAKNKVSDLTKIAKQYGATGVYQSSHLPFSYLTMTYLPDGREDLSENSKQPDVGPTSYDWMTHAARTSLYQLVDDSLVRRFILPENDARKNSTAIPVIITDKEAADMFGKKYGIGEKPKDAAAQIAWMKNLQKKVNGATYVSCYRNDADKQLFAQATQAAANAAKNKDNPDYMASSLVYGFPTKTCGAFPVKSDTRTAAEKDLAQRQEKLQKELGVYEAPRHQLFTFQVVGIMAVEPDQQALKSLSGFVSQLLSAQYGNMGAIVPKQMFEKLPESVRHDNIISKADMPIRDDILTEGGLTEAVVEFGSVDDARKFMNEQGCSQMDMDCKKLFRLDPYGSNYLLVDDITKTAGKALGIALPIALAVATVIIWATMARVMIDSRRETAVFRAIGAKRSDIMAVYLLYSLNVALRIVIFAVIFGLIGALVIQMLFGQQTTDYAKVSYGVFDSIPGFSFLGFTSPLLLLLALCIVGVSLFAVLPPLLRNVRRSPINDMRDE